MDQQKFLRQLLLITGGLIIAVGLSAQMEYLQPHFLFSWISLGLFFGLALMMFYMGMNAAKSGRKGAFISLVMGFTFGKMLLSIVILLVYYELMQPINKGFVVPFFVIYFVYTIYETYFMMKISH